MSSSGTQAISSAVEDGDIKQATSGLFSYLADHAEAAVTALILVIIIALVTLVAARIVRHIFQKIEIRLLSSNNPTATIFGFFRHVIVFFIYFAGVCAMIACIPPLRSALNHMLAAGGILAVIAGLASQAALGDVVAGLMILTFKPFVLGNVVRYVDQNISGVVEEITLHHTTIRTWENKRVIIPNSKMNSSVVENADYSESKVCRFLDISITYESDLALAKKLLAQDVRQHPLFVDNRTAAEKKNGAPDVLVRVQELGDSAVVLRAFVWAKNNADGAEMFSDLLQSVKESFEKNGICLAYPHLVVVENK